MQKVLGPIRRIRFSQSTLRQASIQEKKGPSLGKIQLKILHQRSPYAMKFEDRPQKEKRLKDKSDPPASRSLKEREFVEDFGASMHLVSKKNLQSAQLETMRTSTSPTTVMTANGEVQTREEATVFVKELDLFVTVMLLEETPAVLSLGKLCEDHGYTNHWTSGQKPHLIKNDKKIVCNITNFVPFVVPGLSTSSSSPSSSSTRSPSSSQESISANRENRYLENPVSERSEGTNGELCGETRCKNPQK